MKTLLITLLIATALTFIIWHMPKSWFYWLFGERFFLNLNRFIALFPGILVIGLILMLSFCQGHIVDIEPKTVFELDTRQMFDTLDYEAARRGVDINPDGIWTPHHMIDSTRDRSWTQRPIDPSRTKGFIWMGLGQYRSNKRIRYYLHECGHYIWGYDHDHGSWIMTTYDMGEVFWKHYDCYLDEFFGFGLCGHDDGSRISGERFECDWSESDMDYSLFAGGRNIPIIDTFQDFDSSRYRIIRVVIDGNKVTVK